MMLMMIMAAPRNPPYLRFASALKDFTTARPKLPLFVVVLR